MKPILFDLFCGAGGAGQGYIDMGFDVVGIDIEDHPNYPGEFHVADAMEVLTELVNTGEWCGIRPDAIHASPPCQGYARGGLREKSKFPRLIPDVREALISIGVPYVIENVDGAMREMIDPHLVCGSWFALQVRRHRLFETSFALPNIPCRHKEQGTPIGVYGQHPDTKQFLRPNGKSRGLRASSLEEGQVAMGIDWMDWKDLTEAIPPAYTRFVGHYLMRKVEALKEGRDGSQD